MEDNNIRGGERHIDYQQILEHYDGYYMANYSYEEACTQTAKTRSDADMSSFCKLFMVTPDLLQHFKADVE